VGLERPAGSLEHRIDIVMFHGALKPVATEIFGTERQTPAGRWASDHLGYLAVLALP
jgi:hypothetical protein